MANLIPCQGVFLKQFWRFGGLIFLLTLASVFRMIFVGRFEIEIPSKKQVAQVLFCTLIQMGWSMGTMWAFVNTVQSHAYSLTNLGGVLTVLYFLVTC